MSEDELPEGWESVRLADVAEVRLGRQRSPDRATGPHMRPYMRAANVGWDGLRLDDVKEMDFSPYEFATYELLRGDVIVGEASGSRSEVGKSAVWRGEVAGACFQNTLIRVRADAARALPDFIQLHLAHDAQRGALAEVTKGIGIHHLGREGLANWSIALPPLPEQRRIVAKLDALRARSRRAKDALDAVPALLDRLRQSILAAAFRGDLTADWREQHPDVEPASELLGRIRIERLRRLESGPRRVRDLIPSDGAGDQDASWFFEPEARGWELSTLEELCDPRRGIPYGIVQTGEPEVRGIPTVRCGDIKAFTIDANALKLVSRTIEKEYGRTRLLGGEVLLAIRGTVGQPAVAGANLQGANISREIAMIPVMDGVDARFVMYLLASPAGQAMLGQHVKGVAQSGINLSDLRALRVPIPPHAEQRAVVARIEAALAHVARVERESKGHEADLQELDSAVLASAFRGELFDRQSVPPSAVMEATP